MNSDNTNDRHRVQTSSHPEYVAARKQLAGELRISPIPDAELTANIGLYVERMHLSRILLMHDIYRQILNTPGCVMEFGVRWGQNMALFNAFRGMYEPYNYSRKVIGFDTFSGFPSVASQDQGEATSGSLGVGDYGVAENWKERLEMLLGYQDSLSPLAHIKKWELIQGDACETCCHYLDQHKEAVIALAYFDFDIYTPTKACLELILPRLTKGSIVVFDELNCPKFPGETIAFQEVIGARNVSLQRDPNNPYVSWFKW